jgi:short-subunit dehydrogenase
MATALITGGTSGIGAEFARTYARRGYDIILVARDKARLAEMATELAALGSGSVEVLAADLSNREDVAVVAKRLEDQERPVDVLVNNAGFGVHLPLLTTNLDAIDRAFDVMCRTVFVLAGAAARAMKVRDAGTIINVSSTAGYMTMGAYSSIKAWVTSYTEGLAVELRTSNVSVTALCPGWVRTEFHERAGINPSSIPRSLWLDSGMLVRAAIRDAARGKTISIPSARYKVLIWGVRHLPRRTVRWVSGAISSSRSESQPPAQPAKQVSRSGA